MSEPLVKRVAWGNDHLGHKLREFLIADLIQAGYEVVDCGNKRLRPKDDYPTYAFKVAELVARGEVDAGILVCGTGAGMSIAANKVSGVRAVVCRFAESARRARQHNHANVLCMGSLLVKPEAARRVVRTFLTTAFSDEPRHRRRVKAITDCRCQRRPPENLHKEKNYAHNAPAARGRSGNLSSYSE